MLAAVLVELLAGRWQFRRQASSGERMQGWAEFQPQGGGLLRYHEEGRVLLPGGRELSFFRDYLYEIAGEVMTIRFAGPAQGVFQRVALTRAGDAWSGQCHHPCGRDSYASRYRLAPGALEIGHIVTGPNKDYRLETHYRREPGA